MKKIVPFIVFIMLAVNTGKAQNAAIARVEPAFWWVGMKNTSLQILVYGNNISDFTAETTFPGITIKKTNSVENKNYLFIDIAIAPNAKPGVFTISLKNKKGAILPFEYELKARDFESKRHQGFNSSDVLYLIMPDRFSNGDPANDSADGMLEKGNRKLPDGRHGGDLQGVINHLDYIKDLGVTTIWLNPVLENNMPAYTYHGYAMTDLYRVDPRHGSNEKYKEFVNESHSRGLKVVMDMVFNHVGLQHWFIKDLPSKDWIHAFPEFTRSNFRGEVHIDPYASEYDKTIMNNGWFDTTMPDLNQQNPFLARYLIQNSIWWIEYAGLDGIRMDTQPFPDQEFMSVWAKEVLEAYPTLNIVGEAWLQKEAHTAYWAGNSKNENGYNSNLSSITDFPMHYALVKAFTENETWTEGLARLYYVLSHDFLYPNAQQNLIFLDNHDVSRFYSQINHNFNAYKMAMAFLLTTRGIPQIYTGTEILMDGTDSKGHGNMRKDFPGGWATDKKNKFVPAGRSKDEIEAFNFTQKLLNWRKNKPVIHTGKLTHFIPEHGVYVMFRHNAESTVMVILNNTEAQSIRTAKYKEFLTGYKRALNVVEGTEINISEQIDLPAKSALVLELLK